MKAKTAGRMISTALAICIAFGSAGPVSLRAETEEALSVSAEETISTSSADTNTEVSASSKAEDAGTEETEVTISSAAEDPDAGDYPAGSISSEEAASISAVSFETEENAPDNTQESSADAQVHPEDLEESLPEEEILPEAAAEDIISVSADGEEEAISGKEETDGSSPYGDISLHPDTGIKDFSTRRLILAIEDAGIVDKTNVLSSYGGVHLMQYATEEEAKKAYSYYIGRNRFHEEIYAVSCRDYGSFYGFFISGSENCTTSLIRVAAA